MAGVENSYRSQAFLDKTMCSLTLSMKESGIGQFRASPLGFDEERLVDRLGDIVKGEEGANTIVVERKRWINRVWR